ncbi:MAG TPA: sigma-70 family RNA polymerase sigma factor [Opitutaceae bacterium]
MSLDPAIDRATVTLLRHGDTAALNRLIARWQRPLTGFAYRYVQNLADAHDLVAEAFVRLYQQRGRLRPDTNISAWLFTTLTNLCHNHHRWRRRHPTVTLDAPADPSPGSEGGRYSEGFASGEASPDAALLKDESLAAVRKAIDELPHDLKVAIILHHYEHLSYREIGGIVRCSERGVETRLYRARQQLKQLLAAYLHETSPR